MSCSQLERGFKMKLGQCYYKTTGVSRVQKRCLKLAHTHLPSATYMFVWDPNLNHNHYVSYPDVHPQIMWNAECPNKLKCRRCAIKNLYIPSRAEKNLNLKFLKLSKPFKIYWIIRKIHLYIYIKMHIFFLAHEKLTICRYTVFIGQRKRVFTFLQHFQQHCMYERYSKNGSYLCISIYWGSLCDTIESYSYSY